MRTKRVLLLVGLLLVAGAIGYPLLGGLGRSGRVPAVSAEDGVLAADFVLKTIDDKEVSLEEYRGKAVVVVNFWTMGCPPCRYEIPEFIYFYNEYKGKDVVILAVNIGEPRDDVRSFAKRVGINFPVLLDLSGQVTARYRVEWTPTTFVLDKSGVIRAKVVGPVTRRYLESVVKPLL